MQPKSSISHSTTQLFLDIYDITNDFIILGDGAVSLVISVSAMNFGLLSENEQDATIYAYAALLNSLSFPIQVVIRSQPKDVTGYLKRILDQENRTTNDVYRQKIREYRAFVESLVQEQNVLDKKFYIVIPLSAVEMGLTTQSVIPGAKNKPITSFDKNYIIDKAKTNLYPRRDHLIDQLARIGLYSKQLTTQELIQMLYSSYNPESFEGQKVTDTSHYTTPLVQAKIQGDQTMSVPDQTTPNTLGSTPSPTATAPISPTTNATPQFNQTALGYTTPNMNATPNVAPAAPTPAPATPVSTSSMATPTPSPLTPPSPVSGITESPIVSTPPETKDVSMNVVPTPAADPQVLINQTLGQMPATSATPPTSPSSAPVTPVAPLSPPLNQPMMEN